MISREFGDMWLRPLKSSLSLNESRHSEALNSLGTAAFDVPRLPENCELSYIRGRRRQAPGALHDQRGRQQRDQTAHADIDHHPESVVEVRHERGCDERRKSASED